MPRAFGTTPHGDIVRALEAENRQHTFVEAIQVPSGGSGGVVTMHTKKYELRIGAEELLTLLDSLGAIGGREVNGAERLVKGGRLTARQLRGKILATLGLYEEG